jgi:hypothetical protein
VLFTLIIFCPKTLSMISRGSIFQDDIVRLLVDEDGLEEQMYAIVGMNTGNTLGVKYLSPTNKIYKSACVYQLETGDLNPAPFESICEHYLSGTKFTDIGMKLVGENMYSLHEEIDVEDNDSDIYEDHDDSDTDSEMADFIVPDDGDVVEAPPGQDIVDREWNNWEPSTLGAKSYKDTIDTIERYARSL